MLYAFEQDMSSEISTNRQDLPPCCFLAHNFWVLRVESLKNCDETGQPPWTFMGNKIAPYLIEESVDIHKETDLYLARKWIECNYLDR